MNKKVIVISFLILLAIYLLFQLIQLFVLKTRL